MPLSGVSLWSLWLLAGCHYEFMLLLIGILMYKKDDRNGSHGRSRISCICLVFSGETS